MYRRSLSPGCEIVTGNDDSPKMVLTSPDGAIAEVYLHGAHVASWIPAGGTQKLYLSEKSAFNSNASIRGGIPVIFPQFSDQGPLPRHGFARRMEWQPVLTQMIGENVIAGLTLAENADTMKIWPYAFSINLFITLSCQELSVKLRIKNTGNLTFSFTSALHTYLLVEDIKKTKINGLFQCPFLDTTREDKPLIIQAEKSVRFKGEVDRIYPSSPSDLKLVEDHSHTKISAEGFMDTVIWNPWEEKSALLADMPPQDYLHMVCVEAAVIQNPIVLEPQKTWTGSQTLSL